MSIEADLRDWSQTVLEVPNESLNGLPACPYAKEAWKQNKVNVIETQNIGIETICQARKFDNTYDLVVVASYTFPSPYAFTEFINFLNDCGFGLITDVWFLFLMRQELLQDPYVTVF